MFIFMFEEMWTRFLWNITLNQCRFLFTILKYTEFLIHFMLTTTFVLFWYSYPFKLFLHTACCIKQEFKYIHEILWRISVYTSMYTATYINCFVWVYLCIHIHAHRIESPSPKRGLERNETMSWFRQGWG